MVKKIKILLADSCSLFIDGLEQQLLNEQDIECIATARNAADVFRLASELEPDLIVMDIDILEEKMPVSCKCLSDKIPKTKIIILTHIANTISLMDALKAGAKGYFLKTDTYDQLVGAIRIVYSGGSAYGKYANDIILNLSGILNGNSESNCELNAREMQVLKLAASGMSYKEIANNIDISEHTVGSHFTNIYRKIGVQSRTEAVLYGLKRHWYSLSDSNIGYSAYSNLSDAD